MTAAELFKVATYGVVPFWLLLIVLPRWKGTQIVVHSVAAPLLLGGVYVALIAGGALTDDVPPEASFATLDGVMALFTAEKAVLAGWVHYLVLDLFVGAWIARDALRRSVPHWITAPLLLVTFILAPIGLIAYLVARAATGHGLWLLDPNS